MKFMMKFAVLILLAGSLFSCKKSSDSSSSSSYSFQAKFDGNQKNLNLQVLAMKSKIADGIYNLTITGLTKTEEGGITLWSDQDDFVAGKTYGISALNGTTVNALTYTAPLGSSAPTSIWTSSYNYAVVDEQFTCTITEATSTYVKGTFSGIIYQNDETKQVSQHVTEGSFYAKY